MPYTRLFRNTTSSINIKEFERRFLEGTICLLLCRYMLRSFIISAVTCFIQTFRIFEQWNQTNKRNKKIKCNIKPFFSLTFMSIIASLVLKQRKHPTLFYIFLLEVFSVVWADSILFLIFLFLVCTPSNLFPIFFLLLFFLRIRHSRQQKQNPTKYNFRGADTT